MRWMLAGTVVLSLLGSVPALAQQTGGVAGGRVLDPQDRAVPGATVTARSPQTGFTRIDISDAVGLYRIPALPPGLYQIKVEL